MRERRNEGIGKFFTHEYTKRMRDIKKKKEKRQIDREREDICWV